MQSWMLGLVSAGIFALLYGLFAGQLSVTEGMTLILPLIAAVWLTLGLNRVAERRFKPQAPWIRLILGTSTSTAKDTVKVGLFLAKVVWRRPPCPAGRLLKQPFRFGDDSSGDATRRALVAAAVSASPDRYVIDLNADNSVLTHCLVGDTDESDPEWPI